jgi:hypothetical protein
MSIESIERFLEQIVLDGVIGVQTLWKRWKNQIVKDLSLSKRIFLKTTSPDYHGPQLSIMFWISIIFNYCYCIIIDI